MAIDYSKLSDDELKRIAGVPSSSSQMPQQSIIASQKTPVDMSQMSDADLMKIAGITPPPQTPVQQTTQGITGPALFGALEGATFGNTAKAVAESAKAPTNSLFVGVPGLEYTDLVLEPDRNKEQIQTQFAEQSAQAQQESPLAFTAGEIGTGIAKTIPLGAGAIGAGGKLLKGGKVAQQVGKVLAPATRSQRLVSAASTGGVQGFFSTPNKLDDADGKTMGDRLDSAIESAASGLLFGAGVEGASSFIKAAKQLPNVLKKQSELLAVKSLGPYKRHITKVFGKGMERKLGQYLLDNKLVAAGDNVENIAIKLAANRKDLGARIGSNIDEISESIGSYSSEIDTVKISKEIGDSITKELTGRPGGRKSLPSILSRLDDLKDKGNIITPKELIEFRRGLDKEINFAKLRSDLSLEDKGLTIFREKINKIIESKAMDYDKVFKTDSFKNFKALNRDFNLAKTAEDITIDRLNADRANRLFSLTSKISGSAGGVAGAIAGGAPGAILGAAATGAGTQLIQDRGPSLLAKMTRDTSKILQNNPSLLGKYAEPLLTALEKSPVTYSNLINELKNDSEFVKIFGKEKK